MEQMAEAGVAAHWLYKVGDSEGSNHAHRLARQWLQGLLEMQKNSGDSIEFLENLRIDLFPEEIYVFTPKGKIMALPRGATAVDFAYAVHTDVGNHCVAARVGRELVPLSTQLETGESVEVITAKSAHPNAAWLNFVTTAKARTNIRHYLKHLRNDEAVVLGKRMLIKHLQAFSVKLEDIPQERIDAAIAEFEVENFNQILEDIGLGDRPALMVAHKLLRDDKEVEDATQQPLVIAGTEGMVVSFARCCRPIPGDLIRGFISSGRGIVVHQQNCKTTLNLRDQSEKWLDVVWAKDIQREFPVEIVVHVKNQRGALATIASAVSSSNSNIDNVVVDEREGGYSNLRLTIEVKDRQHLARVMRRIKRIEMVERISRVK
jgi:GTP pyrophosphokinase/guanosine-3',5'-bis(diphosphate) 3'-pyrophosphohydrolase